MPFKGHVTKHGFQSLTAWIHLIFDVFRSLFVAFWSLSATTWFGTGDVWPATKKTRKKLWEIASDSGITRLVVLVVRCRPFSSVPTYVVLCMLNMEILHIHDGERSANAPCAAGNTSPKYLVVTLPTSWPRLNGPWGVCPLTTSALPVFGKISTIAHWAHESQVYT